MSGYSINRVIETGNLTRDSELRYAGNGNPYLTFSIAVSESVKSGTGYKDLTYYFDCVVWGKYGEAIAPKMKKGQGVFIEGKLTSRKYQAADGSNRYVTEISADKLILVRQGGRDEQGAGGANYDDQQPADNGYSTPNY